MYGPPLGALLMAEHEGKVAGMVGLRPLSDEIAEMKRLFVLLAFQGKQIGRMLVQAFLERAKALRYRKVRLDTVAKLVTANALYRRMGFYAIPPYRFNPFPDAMFWEKTIA